MSDLKTDSQGDLIVAASIVPLGFPTSNVVGCGTSSTGLVKKIDPQGNEMFSRLLAGACQMKLAIDQNGDIYVAGQTSAPDELPFTNILYTPPQGGQAGDGFVAKFHGDDGTLVYAAEIGGAPSAILVDSHGQALFTMTAWQAFHVPVTFGAYSYTGTGFSNLNMLMYIVRLSAAGDNILLSSLYSGTAVDCLTPLQCQSAAANTQGNQILLDGKGNIWVTGNTDATDLPVTPNAFRNACATPCPGDGFLAEFNKDGSALLYATYLGTPTAYNSEGWPYSANSASMDSAGHIWIAGITTGTDFPVTSNAIQQQPAGGSDGFLAEYDSATNALLYATYFGGAADDIITNVQVAADGTIVIAGHSLSSALPVAASGFKRGPDFLATLDPDTYSFDYLTTFASGSAGVSLVMMPQEGAVISGTSNIATVLQPGTPANGVPSLYAVTNSADFLTSGQVAVGELITLFGAAIGPATPAAADLSSGLAPKQLGGVQVIVDGAAIPLLYAQNDQINAIIPLDLSASFEAPYTHTLTVTNGGAGSDAGIFDLVAADPQAFSVVAPFAAVLNQDGTVNSRTNPAASGTVVSVFGTGFGSYVGPPPADGSIATAPIAVAQGVQVIGDPSDSPAEQEVTYAGTAPTLVTGVTQVNFRLPIVTGVSAEPFAFNVAGVSSSIFYIWVQ